MPAVEGLGNEYPAGTAISPHTHDTHQVIHAASGVLRVTSTSATWVVPPGRAIWMPAGRIHAIHCHTAVTMRTVYLHGDHPSLPGECAVWSISPLLREVLVRFSASPPKAVRAHLTAILVAEIETIDTLPLLLPEPKDPRLKRITAAIAADPSDPRSAGDWAREVAMSKRNLFRRFVAETGMTMRTWRRQARLLRALELLADGSSVTEAAFTVGYGGASAFIETFREVLGTTPRRYFDRG